MSRNFEENSKINERVRNVNELCYICASNGLVGRLMGQRSVKNAELLQEQFKRPKPGHIPTPWPFRW